MLVRPRSHALRLRRFVPATASTRIMCRTSSPYAAILPTSCRARATSAQGAADLLHRYGTLEALLKAGRFAAQAKELRMCRAIATMDRQAPLPRLPIRRRAGTALPLSRAAGASTSWPTGWSSELKSSPID